MKDKLLTVILPSLILLVLAQIPLLYILPLIYGQISFGITISILVGAIVWLHRLPMPDSYNKQPIRKEDKQ